MADDPKYPPGFTPDNGTDTLPLPKGFVPDEKPQKKKLGQEDFGIPLPVFKTGGTVGSSVGSSNGKSREQLLKEKGYVQNKDGLYSKPDEEKPIQPKAKSPTPDPVGDILNPLEESYNKANTSYKSRYGGNRLASDMTAQQPLIKNLSKEKEDKDIIKSFERATSDYEEGVNTVQQNIFPSPLDAKDYLQAQINEHGVDAIKDNKTVQLAADKVQKYENVKQRYQQNPDLTQLAVDLEREADPNFDKQLTVLEGGENDRKLDKYEFSLNGAVQGAMVERLINDPNIKALAYEEPKVRQQLDELEGDNLYKKYPERGLIVARNIISREYQKRKANKVINPIFNKSSYLNGLAEELFKDRPVLYELYQKELKDKWEGKVDTPGLVDEYGTGARKTVQQMGESFKDVIGAGKSERERIDEGLTEQYSQVNSGVSGAWQKLGQGANLLGMFSAMGAVGAPARALGIAPKVVHTTINGLTFLDQEKNTAAMVFPGEEGKQNLRAWGMTALYTFGLRNGLPTKKIGDIIAKARPEMDAALKNMSADAVEGEIKGNALNVLGNAIKGTVGGAGEMVGLTSMSNGLDNMLGADMKKYHPDSEVPEAFEGMLIGLAAPQLLSAIKNRKAVSNSLYDIAQYGQRYRDVLTSNPDSPETQKQLENIDFLQGLKKQLDAEGITEPNQKRFLIEALNEKYAKEKIPQGSPESAVTRRQQKEISRFQEVQDKILAGEDVAGKEEPTEEDKLHEEKPIVTPEGINIQDKAKELAANIGGKVVGSASKEGTTPKDIDIRIDKDFDKEATDKKMEDLGYESRGSSLVSPEEAKVSGKTYSAGWQRAQHFENKEGQKIDVWHDEPIEKSNEDVVGDNFQKSNEQSTPTTGNKPAIIRPEENKVAENIPLKKANETTPEDNKPVEPIPAEEESPSTTEPIKDKPTAEEGEGEPPAPPSENKPTESVTGEKGNKALETRLVEAKNVPEAAKEGIRAKGLSYEPQSQKEAQDYAKGIIDEMGIDEAVLHAQAQKFGGDVNTLVQTESLNRLAEMSDKETDPAKKLEYDKKFAEIGIGLGEWLRKQGQGISAVNYFYKKSPLGIQIMENVKRKEDFENWAKPKDKSWKEAFDDMMKEPEFEAMFKEQVQEGMKKERAEARKARIKRVDDAIDKAKDQFKGGATYATIIPPKVIEFALDRIKDAYHAGENVVKLVQDAIDYISKELGHDAWDKEKFRAEWEGKLKESFNAEELYRERLKKQIAELDQQIANRKRNPPKEKEQKEYDDETKALIEERDKKKEVLDEIVAPQDRLERYKANVKRQIEDLEKQIAEKKRNTSKPKTELDGEAKVLADKRDELKKELEKVAPIKDTAEFKLRQLDKFRKRLKGLTDKQKEDVVRKSFAKIVENGALDYPEFRKIISDVTGRGEMSDAEAARLRELVKQTNAVDEAGQRARTERTQTARKDFHEAEKKAGAAAKELNTLLYNKPNITKRLTSLMQLNTLGIPALVNNPIYNVINHLGIRLPVGIVKTGIERALQGGAKLIGKEYTPEYDIASIRVQKEFFRKLGLGTRESVKQFLTGLNRMDYLNKEIQGQQIRPATAIRDLWAYSKGEKNLTKRQVIDKIIQASPPGITAEIIARTLNLGDKPQRFAAEGAQAAAFAKSLGLKDIDYDLFIDFPREEAYRVYKKKGLNDVDAATKADYIKDTIIKEGERSTFQQDNMLNDMLNRVFGGKDSGVGGLIKATVVSPYIKIPSNAYWSYYNIVNPEVAMLQSMIYAGKAFAKNKGAKFSFDKPNSSAAKDAHEAKYWLAHAAVGIATRVVIMAMVNAGIYRSGNTGDDTKKEREGEQFYENQGTMNLSKLWAWATGGDPDKVKGGLLISDKWAGHFGTVGNTIARKYEDMTPEQKKEQGDFWDAVIGNMELYALQDFEQGVFGNTQSLLSSLQQGIKTGSVNSGLNAWGVNTLNMFANIVHPAASAQIEKAFLPYYTKSKSDTFMQEVKNSMLTRSAVLRNVLNEYPPSKIGIWGDRLDKKDNVAMRLFGISRANDDNFAQPIYEDYKKTNDIGLFPPAVMPELNGKKLNSEQTTKLEEYVGHARKDLIAPFINDQATIDGFDVKYSQLNKDDKKYVLQYIYQLGKDEGVEKFIEINPSFQKEKEEKDYHKDAQKEIFRILQKYKK